MAPLIYGLTLGNNEASKSSTSASSTTTTSSSEPPLALWITLCVCFAIATIVLAWYLWERTRREITARKAAEDEAEHARKVGEKQLAELKTVTALATLLDLNQHQIDEYHRIATGQADRSFRSSQRAMALGLAVLVACFIAGMRVPSEEAKVFFGALAAVGAAFSGFLNRTYIHMYGRTLGQLNRYFDQPVLTGYYLTAERLAQDLPDSPEGEMRKRIIEQVLEASARLNVQPQTDTVPPAPRRLRRAAKASGVPTPSAPAE